MKLEVGKYYRTRDGRKVGPLQPSDSGDAGGYYIKDYGLIKPDGRFGYGYYGWSSDLDLVAEWVDESEHESGQSGAQTHTSPLSAWVKLSSGEPIVPFSRVAALCGKEASLFTLKSQDGDLGHIAFATEIGVGFDYLLCMVVGREWSENDDGLITKVWPTFYLRGRTFDGLLEVRANEDLPSDPSALSRQLLWVGKMLDEKGWD